jgi:hypothetical protein
MQTISAVRKRQDQVQENIKLVHEITSKMKVATIFKDNVKNMFGSRKNRFLKQKKTSD